MRTLTAVFAVSPERRGGTLDCVRFARTLRVDVIWGGEPRGATCAPGCRVDWRRSAMTQWGLDALFNPAKRHMDEEKRRLQSTREEVGDSSGGRRIDLEKGKVRLTGQPDQDAD
ncbi:MAG: hypothetical protein JO147_08760, partial [Actinobacteria bacterium]|nr:hypothetical protein [Actinomycetota bacterium]